MRKIGIILKQARLAKNWKISDLSEITKIRESFINAIENENWETLPTFSVVVGFVKSIANSLDLDERGTIALLRRDYPVKPSIDIPKPEIKDKFIWSPRLTFLIGIGAVVLILFSYLFFQYIKFISPPTLIVNTPTENQIIKDLILDVSGKTDPDVSIRINNQPALVDDSGNFSQKLEISKTTEIIEIKAKSRSGTETVINRKIKVE